MSKKVFWNGYDISPTWGEFLLYKHILAELIELGYEYIKDPEEINKYFGWHISDCDMLIYDEQKDVLRVLTFVEDRNQTWNLIYSRNKKEDYLCCLHKYGYSLDNPKFKIVGLHSGVFNYYYDFDFFYEKRKKLKGKYIDKMCHFETREARECLWNEEYGLGNYKDIIDYNSRYSEPYEKYLDHIINYKISFSVAGSGEINHRDIENLAVGLPIMRLEFINDMNPPLIPNYHYISVPREKCGISKNFYEDRQGSQIYTDEYIRRYNEVKDDSLFLESIAENGRKYYNKYIKGNQAKRVLKSIGIKTF